MIAHKHSRISAVVARIKRIWSELDDANRRMFAIRTGERFMNRRHGTESGNRSARRTAAPTR